MSTETERPGTADAVAAAEGMQVEARTQRQLVAGRFIRHRAAIGGLVTLTFILVLAISSIGLGPIPGWWGQSYLTTGPTLNPGGAPTLSIVPTFLGGEGLVWGEHPFGQDNVGRDYFAIVMRGTQVSLLIAFLIGIVSTAIGTVVGAMAGYFRKRTEAVLMFVTDTVIAIPLLIFAAILAAIVAGRSLVIFGVVIGLVTWTGVARLVRGEFLSLREKEFVEAARAAGTKAPRIIFRHILPNLIGVIIVAVTLAIAAGILLEAALSFLGLGVQPPEVSLGSVIGQYRTAIGTRPWLFWWPGIFIVAIALSVNFIGDGLRDAFDPRQSRVRR